MHKNKNLYHKINQLLILGNGFDLSNNVKSKFSDFINYKFNGLKRFVRNFGGNNSSKSKIVLIEINDLIFNRAKFSGIIPNNFYLRKILGMSVNVSRNAYIKKFYNKLSNFNYWIMCLLFLKLVQSSSWYDIESYLFNFLYNDRYLSCLDNILQLLIDIINDKFKLRHAKSISIIKRNELIKNIYNNLSNKYGSRTIICLYFILVDNEYLYENISRNKDNHMFNNLIYDIYNLTRLLNEPLKSYNSYKDKDGSIHNKNIRNIIHDVFLYLKGELIDFEMSFNDYLLGEIHDDKNKYYEKSRQKILTMLKDLVPENYKNSLYFSLLNFNYTNPLHKINPYTYVRRNIHGMLLAKYFDSVIYGDNSLIEKNGQHIEQKLKEQLKSFHKKYRCHGLNKTKFHLWCYRQDRNIPIIGIDGLRTDVTSPQYTFTKTYNIMRRVDSFGSRNLLAPNVKYIKFFGHSLGSADYSYFEDIFDYYDVLHKPITLIFYYSQYKSHGRLISDSRVSLNQLHSISKLCEHYCRSKSIKTNALLSSLLLEGRLIIRNVNDIKAWPKIY